MSAWGVWGFWAKKGVAGLLLLPAGPLIAIALGLGFLGVGGVRFGMTC